MRIEIRKTGLGLGPRPLGPKDRTGPDFQILHSSENAQLLREIKKGYKNDKLFNLIKEDTAKYPSFEMKDKTLWTKNVHGNEVICIPRECKIITQILDKAHKIL